MTQPHKIHKVMEHVLETPLEEWHAMLEELLADRYRLDSLCLEEK